MIGLDAWEGFLLLLIVPLLFWHQRSRSTPREVLLSIFPVINTDAPEGLPQAKRLLRLTRNQRFILFTAALMSLALCFNGIHMMRKGHKPGKWLIFLDNTPGISAGYSGKTVLEQAASRLKTFSRSVHEADRFTLVTTSPTPQISDDLGAGDFSRAIDQIKAARITGKAEDLVALLHVMSAGDKFKGTILVSPRSKVWRDSLGDADLSHLTIPKDLDHLKGNAGLALLEATPVAAGLYEISGKIVSANLDTDLITTAVRGSNGKVSYFQVPINKRGEGEFQFTATLRPSAPATLTLELDDNLSIDNSAVLTLPESSGSTSIRLEGNQSPILKIALTSFRDFNLERRDSSSSTTEFVAVLDGTKAVDSIDSPTLIIFPSEDQMGFDLVRVWAAPMNVTFHPAHPATRNARFRQFRAARILQTTYPENFEILATAEGIPLILAGTINGHRTVVWNFDPEDNGIYMDPAFPVLLRDTINWLSRSTEVRIVSGGCMGYITDPRTCASQIKESGSINIPDLSGLSQRVLNTDSESRRELGKEFLFLSLLLILVLAVERAQTQGMVL